MYEFVDFLKTVGEWTLLFLAWIVTLLLIFSLGSLLITMIFYYDKSNPWSPVQLFALFNLLWMVPVIVAAWIGTKKLTERIAW